MKKFTDSKQTETLISLGFPLPSTVVDLNDCYIVDRYGAQEVECDECNYSIGELIEMLPDVVESEDSEYATIQLYFDAFNWVIEYTSVETTLYAVSDVELIDALFYMTVKLREEGVI